MKGLGSHCGPFCAMLNLSLLYTGQCPEGTMHWVAFVPANCGMCSSAPFCKCTCLVCLFCLLVCVAEFMAKKQFYLHIDYAS